MWANLKLSAALTETSSRSLYDDDYDDDDDDDDYDHQCIIGKAVTYPHITGQGSQ